MYFFQKSIFKINSILRSSVDACTDSIIEGIDKDGLVIIDNFLASEQILKIKEIANSLQPLEVSPEGDGSKFYHNANEIIELQDFFCDARIHKIAQGYIGKSAHPLRRLYEKKEVYGDILSFDRMYHMDTWKPRLKFFLFLNDVDDLCAPMKYILGSHKGMWRIPMEFKMYRYYRNSTRGYANNLNLSYLGCFWPYEVSHLVSKFNLKEFTCTGKAGSLLIFDARGLHKATPLKMGSRNVLIDYWIKKNHHI